MQANGTHRADAPPAGARAGRSRAYAAATRHSTRVRVFKRLIPVGAAAAVVVVIGVALVDPSGRMGGLSLGPVSLSGTKITMENPRLTGFRNDTRPYEVTATAASQDVRKPNVVELKEMRGRLAMDDAGTTARLEAATGVFDTQKEQLELRDAIRVRTDGGQQILMRSASVDFKAGTVLSREPVAVSFPGGTIDADTLRVTEGGKVIVFEGRVRTVLQGTEGGAWAPGGGDGPADVQASPIPASPAGRGSPAQPVRATEAQPASLRP